MSVFLLIFGLVLFISLVVVHELGHFIAARRNGVKVEEFGIFFPPRIWKKHTKGGFIFTINWIPLGGFVRLKGEHDSDTGAGTFGAASLWAKTKIMVAGVGMNLLAAFILFTLLGLIGIPILIDNQFTIASNTKIIFDSREVFADSVEKNSPASRIGLRSGDQIIAAGELPNLQHLTDEQSLVNLTKQYPGQSFVVEYKQGKTIYRKSVRLNTAAVVNASLKTNNPKGYLGVTPASQGYALQRSTWSSPIMALGLMKQFTILTFKGLGTALKGLGSTIAGLVSGNKVARQIGQTQASSQVAGPVGIFLILKNFSGIGYQFVLMIIGIISLSLAIMNILPIPALDGGRLFLTLITNLIRRPLKQTTEELINGMGIAVLLILVVLITIVDVKRHAKIKKKPVKQSEKTATLAADGINWGPAFAIIMTIVTYLAAGLLGQVFIWIYGTLVHGWSLQQSNNWFTNSVVGQFADGFMVYAIWFGSLVLILKRCHSSLKSLGWIKPRWRDIAYMFLGLVAYFAVYVVVLIIISKIFPSFNLNQKQDIGFQSGEHGLALIYVFIGLVIFPPLVEETIFRGFLYSTLRKAYPLILAALITSLLFALPHLFEGTNGSLLWVGGIDTFILSLALVYLREKTGGLWASIGLHMLKNGIAFVSLFYFAHLIL